MNYFLQELVEHGCLDSLASVLLDIDSKMAVLAETTAALAVMADDGKIYIVILYLCLIHESFFTTVFIIMLSWILHHNVLAFFEY